MRLRSFVGVEPLVVALLLAVGCGGSATSPAAPANSSVVISATSPSSGGTVVVPPQYPHYELGGVVLPRESGLISVSLSISSAREVPFGQMNVYLLTGAQGSDYCGQNLPDSPTWQSLPPGWTTTHTVSGFQVYRLPCAVTGVRAIFHTRNSGALLPPTAAETIAEATLPVSIQIRY